MVFIIKNVVPMIRLRSAVKIGLKSMVIIRFRLVAMIRLRSVIMIGLRLVVVIRFRSVVMTRFSGLAMAIYSLTANRGDLLGSVAWS